MNTHPMMPPCIGSQRTKQSPMPVTQCAVSVFILGWGGRCVCDDVVCWGEGCIIRIPLLSDKVDDV